MRQTPKYLQRASAFINLFAAHVNDGKVRVYFSGVSDDIPAIYLVSTKFR